MAVAKSNSTKNTKTKGATPFKKGKAYVIRTVTMTWAGEVVNATPSFVTLKKAAWVADTGRFHQFIKSGDANEVEAIDGEAIIGVGSVVDAIEVSFALPLATK
jgi:hypothetical protein